MFRRICHKTVCEFVLRACVRVCVCMRAHTRFHLRQNCHLCGSLKSIFFRNLIKPSGVGRSHRVSHHRIPHAVLLYMWAHCSNFQSNLYNGNNVRTDRNNVVIIGFPISEQPCPSTTITGVWVIFKVRSVFFFGKPLSADRHSLKPLSFIVRLMAERLHIGSSILTTGHNQTNPCNSFHDVQLLSLSSPA